ncbi:MAG: hypothetical protein HY010_13590 [Acidobacteria bacterium]|nr:hypothetical protein [Acidobacteriota bacterium]
MKRTALFWILTLLLLPEATLRAASQSALQLPSDVATQITVRVRNYAQIESNVLSKAETTARKILHEAGVNTLWLVCFDGTTWSGEVACTRLPGPMDLVVNVLPLSMSRSLYDRGDAFGYATEGGLEESFGSIAWIFYDSIHRLAAERQLCLGQLLGYAFAHELGHLLLGPKSHSGVGLMRSPWSSRELLAADQGALFFSASESRRLQEATVARWQEGSRAVRSTAEQQVTRIRTDPDSK